MHQYPPLLPAKLDVHDAGTKPSLSMMTTMTVPASPAGPLAAAQNRSLRSRRRNGLVPESDPETLGKIVSQNSNFVALCWTRRQRGKER